MGLTSSGESLEEEADRQRAIFKNEDFSRWREDGGALAYQEFGDGRREQYFTERHEQYLGLFKTKVNLSSSFP